MSIKNSTASIARGFKYPLEKIEEKGNIYIYGKGSAGTAFLAWMAKCRPNVIVLGFIDSNQSGTHMGLPVYSLDCFFSSISLDSYNEILIVSVAHYEIEKSLKTKALNNYRVITPPVYLLANILLDPQIEKEKFNRLILNYEQNSKVSSTNLHLFFGENMGKFVGNNKYFYLYLKRKLPNNVYWVAKNKECINYLRDKGISVIDANADDFIDYLNRASHFYFDKMSWQKTYPWLRYFKAKKIHTSHGVGLKYTELMQIPDDFLKKLNKKEINWLYSNVLDNDLLLSTSEFYATNVSVPGYGTAMEKISFAGYPKNDVLYQPIEGEDIYTDNLALKIIRERKKQAYKVICYTPTCRHMDANHHDKTVLNLQIINHYCKKIKALFVIKGHGLTETDVDKVKQLEHIIVYRNESDFYPAFRETDVLISDYSSIYMDFLHTRKPIIFYPYDFKEYTELHNPLQFDYNEMTPGPKAYNWAEVEKWLDYFLVQSQDEFKLNREKIFALAYLTQTTGASERLLNDMKQKGLVN